MAAAFLQREPRRGRARHGSHGAAPPLRRRRALRGRAPARQRARPHRPPALAARRRWRKRTASRSSSIRTTTTCTGVRVPGERGRRPARRRRSTTTTSRTTTWDAVWESAVTRGRPGLDGGDARSRSRSCASRPRPGHTWGVNARRVVHRKNESLLAGARAEERERARLAHGPPRRASRGIRAGPAPGAAALRLGARRSTSSPRGAGNPFNDGSRTFGGRGPRPQVRPRHAT